MSASYCYVGDERPGCGRCAACLTRSCGRPLVADANDRRREIAEVLAARRRLWLAEWALRFGRRS